VLVRKFPPARRKQAGANCDVSVALHTIAAAADSGVSGSASLRHGGLVVGDVVGGGQVGWGLGEIGTGAAADAE
jgi:hypothetical protein